MQGANVSINGENGVPGQGRGKDKDKDKKDQSKASAGRERLAFSPDLTAAVQKDKPKYEPPPLTTRIGRRKKKAGGPNAAAKLPSVYPTARCKLRYLRMQRIHDHLLLEEEYVENQERIRKAKAANSGHRTADGDDDAIDQRAFC